jgi:hypothetical protein
MGELLESTLNDNKNSFFRERAKDLGLLLGLVDLF